MDSAGLQLQTELRWPVKTDPPKIPPSALLALSPSPWSMCLISFCLDRRPVAFPRKGPIQGNQGHKQNPFFSSSRNYILVNQEMQYLKLHVSCFNRLPITEWGSFQSYHFSSLYQALIIMLPSEQISLLSKTLPQRVYIVFAWLTLDAIELENVVCIVRPLNNVFFKKQGTFPLQMRQRTPYLAQRTPQSILKHNFH